jgi:hypothetical protein
VHTFCLARQLEKKKKENNTHTVISGGEYDGDAAETGLLHLDGKAVLVRGGRLALVLVAVRHRMHERHLRLGQRSEECKRTADMQGAISCTVVCVVFGAAVICLVLYNDRQTLRDETEKERR